MVPARRRPTRQGRGLARGAAIPAPVGGLNARDALADMDEEDAIVLDNYFPRGNSVDLRRGFAEHATDIPDVVETVMEWNGPTGRELFAASDDSIYDVTAAGAVGAAVLGSLTSARWQWTMFTTAGGAFLIAANGADDVISYDGSAWDTPAITGVDPADLIDVTVHKERLWFVEVNSTSAWYLGTDAIAGAATAFELGSVWRMGGRLRTICSVSQDAGAGPDDFLAFISDKGEVALYGGVDPGNDFALVGVYRIGAPIGQRPVVRVGGDSAIITDDGVVSLHAMFQTDRSASARAAITDKIRNLFADSVRAYRTNFGWQGVAYPAGQYAAFNIPISTTQAHQYVMNTVTGAWCRFTGQNAYAWCVSGDALYFGGDGVVYQADTGLDDADAEIAGDMKTAYNYFRDPGRVKRFTMLRPVLRSNGIPHPAITVNVDFTDAIPTAVPTFTASDAVWDTAVFDVDAFAGESEATLVWTTVSGIGRCAAIRMRTRTMGAEMSLSSFDMLYEPAQGAAL